MAETKRKLKKVLVACNTLTAIQQPAYTDHTRFWYRLGVEYGRKLQFYQFNARRMSIDRFRNTAMLYAINMQMDYLMFVDDDMQFDYTIFSQLYSGCTKEGYDILAALNYIRGYPFDPMAFKICGGEGERKRMLHLEDTAIDEASGKIIPCDAIGTAVCLIKLKNLKKIPAPWFLTGPHNTEDFYFCVKARDIYKKTKIGVHTGAITGHLLDPEIISYHNRKNQQAYCESYMTPGAVEMAKAQDRGLEYVNENILPLIEDKSSYVENSECGAPVEQFIEYGKLGIADDMGDMNKIEPQLETGDNEEISLP